MDLEGLDQNGTESQKVQLKEQKDLEQKKKEQKIEMQQKAAEGAQKKEQKLDKQKKQKIEKQQKEQKKQKKETATGAMTSYLEADDVSGDTWSLGSSWDAEIQKTNERLGFE